MQPEKTFPYDNENDVYKNIVNAELKDCMCISQEDISSRMALILDSKLERTGKMLNDCGFSKENIIRPEISEENICVGPEKISKYSTVLMGDLVTKLSSLASDYPNKFVVIYLDFHDKSALSVLEQDIPEHVMRMACSGCGLVITVSKRCGSRRKHGRCAGALKREFAKRAHSVNKKAVFLKAISSRDSRRKRGCPVEALFFRIS